MKGHETEMNTPTGFLGKQVVCSDCREEGDPLIWKRLEEQEREPRHRLTKEQQEIIDEAEAQHLQEHPLHHVYVWNLKKLA